MTMTRDLEWTKEELKGWMDRHGLNQTQASAVLVCSQALVSKMCSGLVGVSKRTVAIAQAHDLSKVSDVSEAA